MNPKETILSENEMFSSIIIHGRPGSGAMGTAEISVGFPDYRALRKTVWPKIAGSRAQRKAKANALIKGGDVAVARFLGGLVDLDFGNIHLKQAIPAEEYIKAYGKPVWPPPITLQ